MGKLQNTLLAIRIGSVCEIQVFGVQLGYELWHPNLYLKWSGFQTSLYFCPTLHDSMVACWPQQSQYFRSGFVARFFWFGFVLRYGRAAQKQLGEQGTPRGVCTL